MKLKIILLSLLIIFANCNTVFPAAIPDDDSAILVPVPEKTDKKTQPKIKKSVRKAPIKKTVKKTTPKKVKKTTPKTQPVKISSLERGIALMKQERYEAAKPYLIKAIQEEKNNPNAWYWYGVYHEKTGGFYQAQHFYSKAVTIDPTFEPLSRIVVYPEDPNGKNPLWDPKRPARVYPIETVNKNIVTIPPDSPQAKKLPSRPQNNNPELPKVPVYTPPDPGSSPLDGDDWRAGIYVPPTVNQARENQSPIYVPPSTNQVRGNQSPIYVPPSTNQTSENQSYVPPSTNKNQVPNQPILELKADEFIVQPENQNNEIYSDSDLIIRADKPVYQPPRPGEKIQTPRTTSVKNPDTPKKLTSSVPRRVVRKNTSKNTTVAQQPRQIRSARSTTRPTQTITTPKNPTTPQTSRTDLQNNSNARNNTRNNSRVSRDVTPSRPQVNPTPQVPETPRIQQVQPVRPTTPTQPTQPTPSTPRIPETPNNPEIERQRENNLPPVGQFSPDPGTISDVPLPPIGQGNNN